MAPCNIFSCAKLMTKSSPQGAWGSKNQERHKRQKCRTHTELGEIFNEINSVKDFYGLWQRVIKDPDKVCLLNWSHYKLSAGLWKNSNILMSWLLRNLRHIFLTTFFFKSIFTWVYLNTIKSMYPKQNSSLHILFCFVYEFFLFLK